MSLIRKLLSHGFLIFTLAVLAAAYYFRADLFPGLMNKGDGAAQTVQGDGVQVVEPYANVAPSQAKATAGMDQPPQFRPDEAPEQGDAGQAGPGGTFSSKPQPPAEGAPQFRQIEEEATAEGEPEWDRPLPKPTASGTPPEPLPPIPEAPAQPVMPAGQPLPAQPLPGAPGEQPAQVAGEPPLQPPLPGQPMMPPGMPGQPPHMAGEPAMPAPPPSFQSAGAGLGGRDAYGPVYGAVRRPRGAPGFDAGPAGADPDQVSLNAARQAYWSGDIERARQEYTGLIERLPDNPDLYGELGNLHYAQGDWAAAAGAYYEAGTRLVKQGRLAQARHLLSVVRGLDKDKAAAFEAYLKEQGRGDLLR